MKFQLYQKETLADAFSYEYWETIKNAYFEKQLWTDIGTGNSLPFRSHKFWFTSIPDHLPLDISKHIFKFPLLQRDRSSFE